MMPEYQQELDVRNETCPIPVMKTKKAFMAMPIGEVLHVMVTDPFSVEDFSILIENLDASLLERTSDGVEYNFYIKKI